jgi:dynein heavy chain
MKFGMIKGQTYHNVSMGQGQDIIAEEKLRIANAEGHWVILNNVHLMPRWLTKLEKIMDDFALERNDRIAKCKEDNEDFTILDKSTWPDSFAKPERFRLFLSSDPSKSIPPGVLNRAIKLTFEPPTGLKANLKRAFCSFNKSEIDEMDKKCKAILFGLCHFHSLMMERKKFGPKGFNMMYPFSLGDLRDSASCLVSYMAESTEGKIPWVDLQYIFGQIMYGGHIVNDFDRLLCMTYLEYYMCDPLLEEHELIPFLHDKKMSFKSPNPTSYDRYLAHIDNELKTESPVLFGLHPNAEIDFRTTQSVQLFNALEKLAPKEQGGGDDDEEVQSPTHVAENAMAEILERFEGEDSLFVLEDIEEMLEGAKGPFQNVFMQECSQINILVNAIISTLKELELGFKGELTMSDAMENLCNSLYMNRVPAVWAKLAWPSLRPLASWMSNLMQRMEQLREWTENPMEIPKVTWISGLINPQSFLTAIMQETAQRNSLELDKLMVYTEVTKQQEAQQKCRDGAYTIGMYLEGARWDVEKGEMARSAPREMYFQMPIVICKAVSANTSMSGIYSCPVYKTEQRGPTFVFCAQLKTKVPSACWVMAGAALLLDAVE